MNDPVLLALLRPDIPVASDGLYRTSSGQVFYEAQLRDVLPRRYADRYARLLQARAVLIRPIASSPHAFPPRKLGWFAEVYRPGRQSPFSVFVTAFQDRDDEWLEKHWNAPDPMQAGERRLRLRLGRWVKPWSEQVIVPIENVAPVPELPLGHSPGSILKETYPIKDDDRKLLKDAAVSRVYVVTGPSFDEVVSYFKGQAEKLGLHGATAGSDFFWHGDGPSGLAQIAVTNTYLTVAGVSVTEAREKWPHLMAGFPEQLTQYHVTARFTDVATAAAYRTDAERKRFAALQNEQEKRN